MCVCVCVCVCVYMRKAYRSNMTYLLDQDQEGKESKSKAIVSKFRINNSGQVAFVSSQHLLQGCYCGPLPLAPSVTARSPHLVPWLQEESNKKII